MGELAERAYFRVCLTLGRLLRSARYATVRIVTVNGEREVRKQRIVYAPLLVWMAGLLLRILGAGVRLLPQREWEEHERLLWRSLYGRAVTIDAGGVLALPCLAGETLAALLGDEAIDESVRRRAIALAVAELAELHRRGFTHADAMAENVLVDLETGVARWFDFETVHDSTRPVVWRRADDVRAFLGTCLVRTAPERRPETVRLIVDCYGSDEVTRVVAAAFASTFQRPLAFHVAQAPLSHRGFVEVGRSLADAAGYGPGGRDPGRAAQTAGA